jgi:hypothetical protein
MHDIGPLPPPPPSEPSFLLNTSNVPSSILTGFQPLRGSNIWGQHVDGTDLVDAQGNRHTVVGVLPAGNIINAQLVDINDRGVIVGNAQPVGFNPHGFIFRDVTSPVCTVTRSGTTDAGRSFTTYRVRDDLSGLKTIGATKTGSVLVMIGSFVPGTFGSVDVTVARTSTTLPGSASVAATDIAGNVGGCEPVR